MTIIAPPFTRESALKKVQMAEELWNSKNPQKVVLAYTEDCVWRNRDVFFSGHVAIIEFLTRKWQTELDYHLKKDLFIFSDDKIAVQFSYTWHDNSGNYFCSYGLEHWEFAEDGRMKKRTASINDVPYKIRPANLEDLSSILSMVKDLSDAHARYDEKRFVAPDDDSITHVYSQWISRAASSKILCLIAEEPNEKRLPIGYVIAEKFDAEAQYWSGAHIYIHDIYCVKEARKFGLGKALIASINQWAISSSISQIRGLVASENHASLAFFNHQGFRACATEIIFDITNETL